MSDAGRPRTPTQLKVLAGTSRADRSNPREPGLTAAPLPPPPRGISRDERASWLDLAALIDPMRVATAADVVAFRGMVEDHATLRALRRALKSGVVTKGRVHPAVSSVAVYRKLMFAHLARWGLTPADRSRVSTLESERKMGSSLDRFRVV